MALCGIRTQRNADLASQFTLSLTCAQTESEATWQPTDIDNLVLVKFKVTAKMSEDKRIYTVSISSSKHDLAKNKNISINIHSESLDYSATNVEVHEGWSEWRVMGCKESVDKSNQFITIIRFVITVYEDTRETVLSKLSTDSEFTDFNLATSEGSVPVHKACLAAHSDAFRAMLTKEWKETTEGQINMKGITIETLQQLKDYMYMGTLPNDGLQLQPLLLIAKCYLIEDLEKRCIKKLAETVTGDSLYSLIEFACDNNIPELAYTMLVLTQTEVIEGAKALRKVVSTEK